MDRRNLRHQIISDMETADIAVIGRTGPVVKFKSCRFTGAFQRTGYGEESSGREKRIWKMAL